MDELRECPACAELAAHFKWDGWAYVWDGWAYVACAACNATGPWENSEAAAAAAWNALSRRSDTDALRSALERERERSAAYAAELERCGKELERRQHRIRALETAAQWEPVEDGAQVQMENFYWEYDAGEVSKWDYESGRPYDQMDLPAEWCLMRRTYAAPAAEEAQRWEPVKDGYTYTDENGDTITVSEGGSFLYIRDDNSWVKLPANVRLCILADAAEVTP